MLGAKQRAWEALRAFAGAGARAPPAGAIGHRITPSPMIFLASSSRS